MDGVHPNPEQAAEDFVAKFEKLRREVSKFIVGQEEIIQHVLVAILCGGHVLLEGVPGLGKTALVTTISRALHAPRWLVADPASWATSRSRNSTKLSIPSDVTSADATW